MNLDRRKRELYFFAFTADIINEWPLRLYFEIFLDSLKDSILGFVNVAIVGLLSFS